MKSEMINYLYRIIDGEKLKSYRNSYGDIICCKLGDDIYSGAEFIAAGRMGLIRKSNETYNENGNQVTEYELTDTGLKVAIECKQEH